MKKNIIKAFTLIEIVVSLTIFSIVIVSIIWIYITSTDILIKSDINRKMQENVKNVSTEISEDIRKSGINGVSATKGASYNIILGSNRYKEGTGLYTKSENKYYLALLEPTTGDYIRVNSIECKDINTSCVIYRLSSISNESGPLTNSFVSVKDLNFYLSNDKIPKVTLSIIMQPSIKKGVKPNLIENSKLNFQTTISERQF